VPPGLAAVSGVPHASQNVACGRFSCWHRGQCIPSVSRFRIVRGQPGTASRHPGSHQSSASRPSLGARQPDPSASRPRAPDGRFRASSPRYPNRGASRHLRRVRTHVYATLLTATRGPGALTPIRLSPHRNRPRGIPCSARNWASASSREPGPLSPPTSGMGHGVSGASPAYRSALLREASSGRSGRDAITLEVARPRRG
jgi:hypothetical protein